MADRKRKDPNAVLDYDFNWRKEWLADGDDIDTSLFIITGNDSALIQDSITNTTDIATIWLSGGTLGETYTVVNRITTTGGRTQDWTLYLTIAER